MILPGKPYKRKEQNTISITQSSFPQSAVFDYVWTNCYQIALNLNPSMEYNMTVIIVVSVGFVETNLTYSFKFKITECITAMARIKNTTYSSILNVRVTRKYKFQQISAITFQPRSGFIMYAHLISAQNCKPWFNSPCSTVYFFTKWHLCLKSRNLTYVHLWIWRACYLIVCFRFEWHVIKIKIILETSV